MVTLRNSVTGVVVTVSEDVATALGAAWKPVQAESEPAPKKAQPRSTRRK